MIISPCFYRELFWLNHFDLFLKLRLPRWMLSYGVCSSFSSHQINCPVIGYRFFAEPSMESTTWIDENTNLTAIFADFDPDQPHHYWSFTARFRIEVCGPAFGCNRQATAWAANKKTRIYLCKRARGKADLSACNDWQITSRQSMCPPWRFDMIFHSCWQFFSFIFAAISLKKTCFIFSYHWTCSWKEVVYLQIATHLWEHCGAAA